MEQMILVAHLLIALAIVGLILLQQGKGAEMGASFGAGASQTLFGADGSTNVLTRVTAVLAAAFFVTSFGLAVLARDRAAAVDELDIPIPVVEEEVAEEPPLEITVDSDLPVVDEESPAVVGSPDEDLPAVEEPAESSEPARPSEREQR